jgi:ParB/RepB/Spo0J family partition protein
MPKTLAESLKADDVTRFSKTVEMPPEALVDMGDARAFKAGEIEGLMESLAALGQIQDIAIRRGEDGTPIVKDGRRRVAAMVMYNRLVDAGKRPEPKMRARCTISDADDVTAMEQAIAANADRVNPTPIDDAHAIQLLLGMGRTREQIATRYRQQQPWISRRLSLMDLPIALQKRVHKGRLSADAGYKLTFLGTPERMGRMITEIEAAGQEVTGPEIERRRLAWEKEEKRKEAEEHEQALAPPEPIEDPVTFIQADSEAPPFTPDGEPPEEFNAGGVAEQPAQQPSTAEPEPTPTPKPKRGRGRPKGSKSKNPKPKAIRPRSPKAIRAFFKIDHAPAPWGSLCESVLAYMDGKISDDELNAAGVYACGGSEESQQE